jgi:hypothetical protein
VTWRQRHAVQVHWIPSTHHHSTIRWGFPNGFDDRRKLIHTLPTDMVQKKKQKNFEMLLKMG